MRIFFLVLLLSVSACVTIQPTTEAVNRVLISDGVYFDLLPAQLFLNDLSMTQLVEVSLNDQQHSFIVQMEIDTTADSLNLVGLTRLGIKVFDLSWKAGKMKYWMHENVPHQFSPSFLLADIQLALWPKNYVEMHLSGARVELQQNEAEPNNRILKNVHGEILRIQFYTNDKGLKSLRYRHLIRQYSINVDTLSIETL